MNSAFRHSKSGHIWLNNYEKNSGVNSSAVKIKVKFSIQDIRTYTLNGVIAPLILNLGIRCRWVVSLTSRLFCISDKRFPVPTEQEPGWAPEPMWTFWGKDEFKHRIFQFVAQLLYLLHCPSPINSPKTKEKCNSLCRNLNFDFMLTALSYNSSYTCIN
jgi:hypothetical protein